MKLKKLLKKLQKELEKENHAARFAGRNPSPRPSPRSRSSSRSRSPINFNENQDAEMQSDSEEVICLDEDFQEALGQEYETLKRFEGTINPKIKTRWEHILLNGLPKEEKETIMKKYKLPDNCELLDSPRLNDEVKNILTDSAKTRDKALEAMQGQLGLATAIIGKIMTRIMSEEEVNKLETISQLSDAAKLLNDINNYNTKTRRLLISPMLDKNFVSLVETTKRDTYLYGGELGTKIKTNQDIQKSASHIKKAKSNPKPVTRKPLSGNRPGPPQTSYRQTSRTAAPRGGPRNQGTRQPPPQRLNHNQPRATRPPQRGAHSRR